MREPTPQATVAFHSTSLQRAVRFGPFRFDWRDLTLTRDGEEIRLPPRALAVLAHLLERPGRVVAKQELIDAVWKDAFVSESSLTEAVGVLRHALGDTAAHATYIQTLHRRGYRFVAPLHLDPAGASTLSAAPLREAAVAPDTTDTEANPPLSRTKYVIAAVTLVMLCVAGWLATRGAPDVAVTRTTITLPESMAPAPGLMAHTVVAASPDGRRLVYVAGSTGSFGLYLRAFDRFDAVPIPGTEGGYGPFFSPDGGSLGFFRSGRLFVTRLPDGEPLDIGAAGHGLGGWWHGDDTIYIATGQASGIMRVAAAGGRSTSVPTGTLNPSALRHPSVTADGRTLLATHWRSNVRESESVAIDLHTGIARVLGRGVYPRSLTDTEVVYLSDGMLVAVPLHITAEPRTLLSGVMTGVNGAGQYSLSLTGTLVYIPDVPTRTLRRLRRLNEQGLDVALPFELRAFQNIAVSPDGLRLAATVYGRGASDLWVGDVTRGTLLRLASEGGIVDPVWSRDVREIYFGSTRSGAYRIYRIAADGSGQPAAISDVVNVTPTSAADGFVLAHRLNADGDLDIIRIAADGQGHELLATTARETKARLSPDGRWMAYESNRTGVMNVFVRPLAGGPDVQVSSDGGTWPAWSPDGRHLYLMNGPQILKVAFNAGNLGAPVLVRADPSITLAVPIGHDVIAVTAMEESRPLTTLHVVGNWVAEVRRSGRR